MVWGGAGPKGYPRVSRSARYNYRSANVTIIPKAELRIRSPSAGPLSWLALVLPPGSVEPLARHERGRIDPHLLRRQRPLGNLEGVDEAVTIGVQSDPELKISGSRVNSSEVKKHGYDWNSGSLCRSKK